MNSAAGLVFSASRYDHVTPLLTQLHWLKMLERIEFKPAVLLYRCLHQTVPPYLAEEFYQSSVVEAPQRLHSTSSLSLVVPRTRLSTIGDRAFAVAASWLWNTLPQNVTSASSLFQETFEDPSFQSFFPKIFCSARAVTVVWTQ